MKTHRSLARAQELRSEMRRLDMLLQASVVLRRTKCGKYSCRCAQGKLHESWSVTYKEKGKTRTISLREEDRAEVRQWAENWKRFRRLLKRHNALLLESIKKPKR